MATREQMVEVLNEKVKEASDVIMAVDTVVENNPEVVEAAARLAVKYSKIFIPMMEVLLKEVVNQRKELVMQLEEEGFETNEAIRLVLGN